MFGLIREGVDGCGYEKIKFNIMDKFFVYACFLLFYVCFPCLHVGLFGLRSGAPSTKDGKERVWDMGILYINLLI